MTQVRASLVDVLNPSLLLPTFRVHHFRVHHYKLSLRFRHVRFRQNQNYSCFINDSNNDLITS